MRESLAQILREDEGLRLKIYLCSAGKLSVGYGRNLEDTGISLEEAEFMLSNDIGRYLQEASKFPWFGILNDARKIVILSMLYNLGLPRFLTFRRMIAAVEAKDFGKAATEMLHSRWRSQVGKRAVQLAVIMKTGGLS